MLNRTRHTDRTAAILEALGEGNSVAYLAKAYKVSRPYLYKLRKKHFGLTRKLADADKLVEEYVADMNTLAPTFAGIAHDRFLEDIQRITLTATDKAEALAQARIAKAAYYFRELVEAMPKEEVDKLMDTIGAFWLPDIFLRERPKISPNLPKIIKGAGE